MHETEPADPSPVAWTPDHFLIEGRYCPASEIRRSVNAWRRSRILPWAVLMPFPTNGATLFGSLMHVTHTARATASVVQQAVVHATTPQTARELGSILARLGRQPGPRGQSSSVSREDAHAVLNSQILTAIAALWEDPQPLALRRPGGWFRNGGARFFVLTPDRPSRGQPPALLRVVRDDALGELEPALHATHQVALHLHEGRQQQRPLHGLSPARPRTLICLEDLRPAQSMSHFGPAHEYQDLLERSRVVELADVAALYLLDRSGRNLSLVASVGTNCAPQAVAMQPGRSALAFVVDRDRPRVTNHARGEPRLHSSIELAWFGNHPAPEDFSEIVVPVTSMATADSAIGALVVQKRAKTDDDVFDIHDLNQLELLSSRVSLRRSNLLFQEATDRLSELTGHNMLASSASLSVENLQDPWQDLPADIVSARQSLERAVHLAHSYTPALATVLYLLDRRQEHLIPAVTVGSPMFDGTPIALPASARKVRGLAPTVLTTGNPILIEDVRDPQALKAYRGHLSREEWAGTSVRCALALPITIFDRTVGVLQLVSERSDALAPSRSFSQAVAHQICTALLLAQRAEEQRAFVFASSTALHAHEILKRVDALRDFPDERVGEIGNQIERLVDSLRDPEVREGLTARDPLEIVGKALDRVGLTEFVVWENTPETYPPVSPSVALALERAADEVFANAKARLESDGRSTRLQLRTKLKLRGGLPRLVIEAQHCAAKMIDTAIEAKIYRTPVEDAQDGSQRRHFGAFTAGYWMRAVGGDVYIWRNDVDESNQAHVGTAIEVPVLTLAPSDGGW